MQKEQSPGDLPTDPVSADYANTQVESKLSDLKSSPDFTRLAELLNALREGYLFVDITGGSTKKKGTRMRTTRTTKGQLVLPIFTSMNAVREAVASGGRRGAAKEVKGAIMPADEALKLIESDRFVAIELNPGQNSLVVLRKFITLALKDGSVSPEQLEAV